MVGKKTVHAIKEQSYGGETAITSEEQTSERKMRNAIEEQSGGTKITNNIHCGTIL